MESVTLVQKSFPFTRLTLTLQGNRELLIEQHNLLRGTRHSFPVHQIVPSPIHHREIPAGWSILSATLLLGFVLTLFDGWFLGNAGQKFGGLFIGGIALACLYNTLKMSRNSVLFRHAQSGQILFSIFRAKPSASAVDQFCEVLQQRIESFRTPVSLSLEESRALYTRHLDYLLHEEVLTQQEYDGILQRLTEKGRGKNVFELVR